MRIDLWLLYSILLMIDYPDYILGWLVTEGYDSAYENLEPKAIAEILEKFYASVSILIQVLYNCAPSYTQRLWV